MLFRSGDTEEEKNRLNLAVGEMHKSIDEMLEAKEMVLAGDHREVFKTYRLFAEDAGWLARI